MGKLGAAFTVAVLVMVSSAMAVTAFSLLASGELIQVGVGIGVLLLVVVGGVLVAGEVQLGAAARGWPGSSRPRAGCRTTRRTSRGCQRTAREGRRRPRLRAAQGRGRGDPDDWRAWWRLAAAYGDARDTGAAGGRCAPRSLERRRVRG
jgi:hypothetical protein